MWIASWFGLEKFIQASSWQESWQFGGNCTEALSKTDVSFYLHRSCCLRNIQDVGWGGLFWQKTLLYGRSFQPFIQHLFNVIVISNQIEQMQVFAQNLECLWALVTKCLDMFRLLKFLLRLRYVIWCTFLCKVMWLVCICNQFEYIYV